MSSAVHKLERPDRAKYSSRPLITDGAAFTIAVPIQWTVACAGVKTAYIWINATQMGNLEIHLNRTNSDEYVVGLGPADTAVVANVPARVQVDLKGVREFTVRFTGAATGTFTFLDVTFDAA